MAEEISKISKNKSSLQRDIKKIVDDTELDVKEETLWGMTC
jgi:hypothetical protein